MNAGKDRDQLRDSQLHDSDSIFVNLDRPPPKDSVVHIRMDLDHAAVGHDRSEVSAFVDGKPVAIHSVRAVTSAHNPARARAFDWADSEGTVDVDEWGPLAVFAIFWLVCVVVLLGLAVWAAVVNWGNA